MKPLYTINEFKNSKVADILKCECYQCGQPFKITKRRINYSLDPNRKEKGMFCSKACMNIHKGLIQTVNCSECGTEFTKHLSEIKKSKSGNHFCSKSCSTSYNNKHKKHGTRRSKLELWIEKELTKLYPDLKINFNQSDTIGSELDIYIPSLNLAFELNGIFHYEPIYGKNKLNQIQENDKSKSKACHDAKIDLCIIDTSTQKYVKPKTSQKYLDIITNIIKERMLTS